MNSDGFHPLKFDGDHPLKWYSGRGQEQTWRERAVWQKNGKHDSRQRRWRHDGGHGECERRGQEEGERDGGCVQEEEG